jgi:UDP-GlcNAc3NAcA epimerase
LVYGDTNSTLAGALVAAKLNIPVAHVEAGLRSYNKAMPEEINRILTDHVSSFLFCPTDSAVANLKREGIEANVFNVGDVMVDMIRIAREKNILSKSPDYEQYYFSTIHRPYNTDDFDRLMSIIKVFNELDKPVKFAVHPRTLHKLTHAGVHTEQFQNIRFLEPVSYFESLQLQYNAKAVITDSGGIQKEAYVLGKKCVTIRSETEWVETLVNGWNTLIFSELINLQNILNVTSGYYEKDIYGDGFASNSIKEKIKKSLER